MCGVVAYRYASLRSLQGRVRMGWPLSVDGRPATPSQRSLRMGWSMMPSTGRPLYSSEMSVPNSGLPAVEAVRLG